jgi:hypothetical protein
MAGSFGFENDKYDLSVNVGERVLLPEVRKAELSTLLIADGFSCREQISQLTQRQALHTAELLSLAMNPSGLSDQQPPEYYIAQRRKAAKRQSMFKAAAAAVAFGVLGVTALSVFLGRKR